MARRTINGVEESTVTVMLSKADHFGSDCVEFTGFFNVTVDPDGYLILKEFRELDEDELNAVEGERSKDTRRVFNEPAPTYTTRLWQCFAKGTWVSVSTESTMERDGHQ